MCADVAISLLNLPKASHIKYNSVKIDEDEYDAVSYRNHISSIGIVAHVSCVFFCCALPPHQHKQSSGVEFKVQIGMCACMFCMLRRVQNKNIYIHFMRRGAVEMNTNRCLQLALWQIYCIELNANAHRRHFGVVHDPARRINLWKYIYFKTMSSKPKCKSKVRRFCF